VRRYTGGGLVDHDRDVTYTLVVPRAHPWMELSAPDSYCHIHQGVQAALAACGVVSELTPVALDGSADACFLKPVKHDIVAGASKLSGAAQRRTREGMLHQGSILLPDPALNAALRLTFPGAFAKQLSLSLAPSALTHAEEARAAALERDRYSTEAWNRSR
jgi:lipoate-protein ligase A